MDNIDLATFVEQEYPILSPENTLIGRLTFRSGRVAPQALQVVVHTNGLYDTLNPLDIFRQCSTYAANYMYHRPQPFPAPFSPTHTDELQLHPSAEDQAFDDGATAATPLSDTTRQYLQAAHSLYGDVSISAPPSAAHSIGGRSTAPTPAPSLSGGLNASSRSLASIDYASHKIDSQVFKPQAEALGPPPPPAPLQTKQEDKEEKKPAEPKQASVGASAGGGKPAAKQPKPGPSGAASKPASKKPAKGPAKGTATGPAAAAPPAGGRATRRGGNPGAKPKTTSPPTRSRSPRQQPDLASDAQPGPSRSTNAPSSASTTSISAPRATSTPRPRSRSASSTSSASSYSSAVSEDPAASHLRDAAAAGPGLPEAQDGAAKSAERTAAPRTDARQAGSADLPGDKPDVRVPVDGESQRALQRQLPAAAGRMDYKDAGADSPDGISDLRGRLTRRPAPRSSSPTPDTWNLARALTAARRRDVARAGARDGRLPGQSPHSCGDALLHYHREERNAVLDVFNCLKPAPKGLVFHPDFAMKINNPGHPKHLRTVPNMHKMFQYLMDRILN